MFATPVKVADTGRQKIFPLRGKCRPKGDEGG
jgi:hypothetical protein